MARPVIKKCMLIVLLGIIIWFIVSLCWTIYVSHDSDVYKKEGFSPLSPRPLSMEDTPLSMQPHLPGQLPMILTPGHTECPLCGEPAVPITEDGVVYSCHQCHRFYSCPECIRGRGPDCDYNTAVIEPTAAASRLPDYSPQSLIGIDSRAIGESVPLPLSESLPESAMNYS